MILRDLGEICSGHRWAVCPQPPVGLSLLQNNKCVFFFFKVTAGVALFQASKTLSPSQHVSREALLLPGIWACGLATVILVSFYLTFKVIKKPHCHNSNF